MGNADKLTGFSCDSRYQTFTAAEDQLQQQTEAERVRQHLES
jgi:hypothetical protein